MLSDIFLISILTSFNLLFFILGIILGKNILSSKSTNSYFDSDLKNNNSSLFTNNKKLKEHDYQQKPTTIDIDERKVVVAIKTEGLEKKYDTLGDVRQSSDNISSSIDKLKNMKGL